MFRFVLFFLTIAPSPYLTKQDIYIFGISQHNNLCFTHDCHSLIQLYQLQKNSSLYLCFCAFVASELLQWGRCHSLLLYTNQRFAYVTASCIWWVCANIHRILNDDRSCLRVTAWDCEKDGKVSFAYNGTFNLNKCLIVPLFSHISCQYGCREKDL